MSKTSLKMAIAMILPAVILVILGIILSSPKMRISPPTTEEVSDQ